MAELLLDNIYRIEIPLPKSPLKTLNSYFIKNPNGRSLLIDTGFNRKECKDAIFNALEELQVDMDKTDLFITHLHSDHCGLVSSLAKPGTKIYCGKIDSEIINDNMTDEYWEGLDETFIGYGFPRAATGRNTDIHPGRRYSNEHHIDFTFVKHGDIIEVGKYNLKCIMTPGHTPSHMCLYDEKEKILFSGDHILGDITPNICYGLKLEDPLKAYFDSLKLVRDLDIKHIFTAHREKVEDPYKRIDELLKHHELRLAEVMNIIKGKTLNAYQVAEHMTWDIEYDVWENFQIYV
jgi:glyoxylase-like metal-dependent hydrolase (beta-lactamase superfamily II)